MPDNGERTTDTDILPAVDTLLGHNAGTLGQVPRETLALLLAASGAVADRLAELDRATSYASVLRPTWTALAALAPEAIGQQAEVSPEDTGSHTDPQTSATVNNAGRYTAFGTEAGQWTWVDGGGLGSKLSISARLSEFSGPYANEVRGNIGAASQEDLDAAEEAIATKANAAAPIPTLIASGTGQAMTAAAPSWMTGYADDQTFLLFPAAANTAADPTLDIGGFGPLPVRDEGGGALVANDLQSNRGFFVRISGGEAIFRLLTRGYDRALIEGLASKAPALAPIYQLSSTGGSANAQTAPAPGIMTGYASNQRILWYPNAANTAADPTLKIGSLAALPIYRVDGSSVEPGEITVGTFYELRNVSGTSWRIIGTGISYGMIRRDMTDLSREGDDGALNLLDYTRTVNEGAFLTDVSGAGRPAIKFADDLQGDALSIPRTAVNSNFFSGGVTVLESFATGRVIIRQMDAGGTEIRDTGDGNGDYRFEQSFAAGITEHQPVKISVLAKPLAPACATIRMYLQGYGDGSRNMSVGLPWIIAKGSARRFSAATPLIMTGGKTAYLAPTGSIGNSGTISSRPLGNMRAALATGASTIILQDGIYDAAAMVLDGNLFGGVSLTAAEGAQPIIRGGAALSGFTAVSGRSNVYQAACPTAPARHDVATPRGFVWVVGEPWSVITMAERHVAHRGRSHRSPHTPLYAGPTDLDSLEAAVRESWWWSGGVLYVNAPSGVDPATMIVQVPSGVSFDNRSVRNRLDVCGVTWEFLGLELGRIGRFDLEAVTVIGAPEDGLSLDITRGSDRYCTVIGSGNDNWNIHGEALSATDNTRRPRLDACTTSHDLCSILAWDDGHSAHEACVASVNGGLVELCGSTGITPANGAELRVTGAEIRDCGWDGHEQAGLALVNSVTDDGTGCLLEGRDLVIRACPRGVFVGDGGGTHKATLYNTRTVDCSEAALRAETGGRIDSYGLIDSGSVARTAGAGIINDIP